MTSKTTDNIKVSVEAHYFPDYSNPFGNEFMFSYTVTIQNNSPATVRLISRKWLILDSDGAYRDVEGEGVMGNQPIIKPGSSFEYTSGCNLNTEMGTMEGSYTMQDMRDGRLFEIEIPRFEMIYPQRFN